MRRKDSTLPLPTLSPVAADELTAQGDPDPPPAAAGNALQKARHFIGLGHTKKANISMEQKHMMALMMADTGAIETTYKDTDSQFDKLDERELAKTLGEEHLDMSVVATIVQDKDRFEKIAPQIREKIMIFILKERLKGRYFLLVDTDHLRVPAREGALFYKRIRRSVFYALLFLLLGVVWLRWLDGDMVQFELRDKRPDMPTTKYLTDTIRETLLAETSAYLRNVYIGDLYDQGSYPQCNLKFMSPWSKWEEDTDYAFGPALPQNCGLKQFIRHRVVLIERNTTTTRPRKSVVKCPHSHETQFNFETCCGTEFSYIKDDNCTTRRSNSEATSKKDLNTACNGATLLTFKSIDDNSIVNEDKLYDLEALIYSGYTAKRDETTKLYKPQLEFGGDGQLLEIHPLGNTTADCSEAVIVFSRVKVVNDDLGNSNIVTGPWKAYVVCPEDFYSINVICQFPLPTAKTFKDHVLSYFMPHEYEDWFEFERQMEYLDRKNLNKELMDFYNS